MTSRAPIFSFLTLILFSTSVWPQGQEKSQADKSVGDSYYNLLVLEGAYQSAQFCENNSGSGYIETWRTWSKDVSLARNVAVLTLKVVAEAAGLSKDKQDSFIKDTLAHIKDETATKLPPYPEQCKDFANTLENFKSSLRQ